MRCADLVLLQCFDLHERILAMDPFEEAFALFKGPLPDQGSEAERFHLVGIQTGCLQAHHIMG